MRISNLDTKSNEALSNEKITDKENYALLNNYENSELDIKSNMPFSKERVIKKENFFPLNNFENTKLNVKNKNAEVSSNEKIITK